MAAAIANVGNEVVRGHEAEGKKCKDEVHDLLLWLVGVSPVGGEACTYETHVEG
jgi:hypothetical protein